MFRNYLSIAAIALLASSCADDNFKANEPSLPGDGITFVADETSSVASSRAEVPAAVDTIMLVDESGADPLAVIVETAPIATAKSITESLAVGRSTPVNEANPLTSFKVYAFKYPTDGSVNGKFFDAEVKNVSGSWSYEPVRYWPDNCTLGFFGIAPVGIVPNIVSERDWSIQYTVSSEPTQQPDIMTATTVNTLTQNDGLVNMKFQHLLSQINFKVNSELTDGTTITSVTLSGVHVSGTYVYRADEGHWTINPGSQSVVVDKLDTDGSLSYNKPDHTLMLLPQDNLNDVTLTVELSNSKTKSATLSGSWVAGTAYTYSINIKPDYTLEFVSKPAVQDAHYVICPLTIKADKLPDDANGWMLTCTNPELQQPVRFLEVSKYDKGIIDLLDQGYWLKDNVNGDTNNANFSAPTVLTSKTTGQDISVYVLIPENIGEETRELQLNLKLAADKYASEQGSTLTIQQLCPAWNENGLGVERLQVEKDYPWGFNWDSSMKITYQMPRSTWSNPGPSFWHILLLIFGNAPYMSQEGVALAGNWKVTIDFSKISQLNTAISETEGRSNTWELYTFDGVNEASTMMSQLVAWGGVPDKTLPTNPAEFAAWYCAKLNPFKPTKKTDNGEVIYNANLDQTDMVWYLPATQEAVNIRDSEYTLNGDYWTSTAITTGDGKTAYKFTAPGGDITPEDRNRSLHVRAVRKK